MGLDYPLRFFFQAGKFLLRLFHVNRREEMLIDLEDRFERVAGEKGALRSCFWLAGQTLQILLGHLLNRIFWSIVMFKNYIRIALRNTAKQKLYALITLSGLICGLAVFILLQLMGERLRRFDQFHAESHRLYSVVQVVPGGMDGVKHTAMTPAPLLPALQTELPEIEAGARYLPAGQTIVRYGDKVFYESQVNFVDADFLRIFSFGLKTGSRNETLKRPYSVVLSSEAAKKYFGDVNPVGKVLILNNNVNVTVTGVLEEIPTNSSLVFQFLVSMETAPALIPELENWQKRNQAAFVMLREGNSPEQMEPKLAAFLENHYPKAADSPSQLYLFPLHKFLLDSEHIENCWINGSISFSVMNILSVLALVIACINYMNLSTARFIKRANEVGLRKVIGATRRQLLFQFLGEAVFMALIALPLAVILVFALKPLFVQYIDSSFTISLQEFPSVLYKALITACFTGVISGLYPALYLSSFTPIKVLQGKLVRSRKGGRIRKTLVVTQFFFSILILMLTLVSMKQTQHNERVDLGFNRQHILALNLNSDAMDKIDLLRREIMRHNNVLSVSAASGLPVSWDPQEEAIPEGKDQNEAVKMNVYGVDYGLTEMLEIPLVAGDSFSRDRSVENGILINQLAAEQLGWEAPLGHRLTVGEKSYVIQGVTENYHFRPIAFDHVMPSFMYLNEGAYNYLLIKYRSESGREALVEHMAKAWRVLMPDLPFEQIDLNERWLDENIRSDKTVQFAGGLGFITILLSCLGLFGLTAYSVERRVKEIGIRKILGAGETGVVFMLSREFLVLVGIANLLALPLSYLLTNRMIHFIFTYPVKLGVELFILAAVMTLVIAFGTVASLSFKAARMNSARALRYE